MVVIAIQLWNHCNIQAAACPFSPSGSEDKRGNAPGMPPQNANAEGSQKDSSKIPDSRRNTS
jgi:hypothetical protein